MKQVIFNKNGLVVIQHAAQRFSSRQDVAFTLFDLRDIISNAQNDIKSLVKGDEALVYSKSKDRAIIIKMIKKNKAVIKTILPPSKQQSKENTIQILTESYQYYGEDLYWYLTGLNEQECEVDTAELGGVHFTWVDGGIWDVCAVILTTN